MRCKTVLQDENWDVPTKDLYKYVCEYQKISVWRRECRQGGLDGDECQGVIYNKLAARVKGKVRPDMMYVLEVVDFHWD